LVIWCQQESLADLELEQLSSSLAAPKITAPKPPPAKSPTPEIETPNWSPSLASEA